MNNLYPILWERNSQKKEERPYVQLPLPIVPPPEKKDTNNEKDKQKRGVYIFEM